jgi:hypothetical protein|tara:strand:- start:1070 stop:1804 length:735 start_codon:yes stop_codon:yes gene_type:complete
MKDTLLDIVKHTHALGFLNLVKIVSDTKETTIESMADDRSVIMKGKFHKPIGIDGTFGMPQLNKLDILLKVPEYKDSAKITVSTRNKEGVDYPTGLHFENANGDFKNDYRFMNAEIIEEKLKTVKFRGVNWDIEFEPGMAAVTRLSYQVQANSEETSFVAKTDNGDLKFTFGDHSTHAGEFIFQPGVTGTLDKNWAWPVAQVLQILKLADSSTVKMHLSNEGALQLTVDSGIGEYQFILPAQSK